MNMPTVRSEAKNGNSETKMLQKTQIAP
jgi:hypothetical protein